MFISIHCFSLAVQGAGPWRIAGFSMLSARGQPTDCGGSQSTQPAKDGYNWTLRSGS